MAKNGTEVVITEPKYCDICPAGNKQRAVVDGKTSIGPWANMCTEHYEEFGIGLGIGKGQRLILKPSKAGAR